MLFAAIKKRCGGSIAEEKIKDLAEFCCYSTLGCILKFIHGGMTEDIDGVVDKLRFLISAVFEKTLANP